MKKEIILSLTLAMLTSMAALAQYSVRFLATDTTGAGEPYATVRLYRAADTTQVLATGTTDLNGAFQRDIAEMGNYWVKISAVGKVTAERQFQVGTHAKVADLGHILLKANDHVLGGVTVTGHATLVKNEIDRLSYNVQNDDDSKTKTVFEMLRKVPLVSIDGQDNILVKGTSNFKIFKNGHPDPGIAQNPKEVLKAIPTSMIKRIEVITEPGAKYDAEGVGAILNIVTEDGSSIKGATGTVTAGVTNYGEPNINTYVTGQTGPFITSVNYGFHHVNKSGSQFSEEETNYKDSGNRLVNTSDGDPTVNVHYGNIESSFEPDTLNLLTLSFGGYRYDYTANGVGTTEMFDRNGSSLYSYKTLGHVPGSNYYNFNGRFDYQHKTRVKDETLTLSYMLSTSRNHNRMQETFEECVNVPMDYSGFDQNIRENFLEHTFQFDWTRPFAQYHKVETGVKYINRRNKSHTTMDYTNAEQENVDNRLNHLTQVASAYASYTFNKGAWSARAGLRYEYSYLNAKYPDGSQESFHTNLNDWVPSASINYKMGYFNSLKLALSTSIARPGISYLNPAVVSEPTSVSYGNSHLKSSRSYSMSLTYMHVGQKFTFNLVPNYSWSSNGICGVQFLDDKGRTVSTYANALTSRSAGLNGFAQINLATGTNIIINGDLSYEYLKNGSLGLKNDGWNLYLYGNITQQLPWRLRLSTGAGTFGGGPDGIYDKQNRLFFYNLGLQRSFLKEDRLTVGFQANRPFSRRYSCFKNETTQGDYTGISRYWHSSRMFNFTISYRFGSLKARVKKTETTIENNDLVGGSSQSGGKGQMQGGSGQGKGM